MLSSVLGFDWAANCISYAKLLIVDVIKLGFIPNIAVTSHWSHGVTNNRQIDCLFNSLLRKTGNHQCPALMGPFKGDLPVTGGFPQQRASDTKTVSMSSWTWHNGSKYILIALFHLMTASSIHKKQSWFSLDRNHHSDFIWEICAHITQRLIFAFRLFGHTYLRHFP